MMKTFFSTGAYRPPVMSAGTGITRMLLLFFCLLFATISADAEKVKYGIKINGKEVTWGNKGTGWESTNIRGHIRFTRDRMPKNVSDRYYRISGTATERLFITVERDVKDCIFAFDYLNFKGYFNFQDCDFTGNTKTNWSKSPNTNTIRICGTNSITADVYNTAPLNIDGQNIIIIESEGGNLTDKHYKLTLNGDNRDCPAIGSMYTDGSRYAQVIIKGGTVEANGGIKSPGIGSYYEERSTPIRPIIEGGYVKAVGKESPGIGGRWGIQDMELKGGTVEASGQGNDIGYIGELERNVGPDKILISGGTMKTTNFKRITAYAADGKTPVYRVEIPLPKDAFNSAKESMNSKIYPSTYIKIKNLKVNGKDYGDEDLFPDDDGKVYIWLPKGNYEFSTTLSKQYTSGPTEYKETVGTYDYKANVNNNHTTAVQIKDFSPSVATMAFAQNVPTEIKPTNVPEDYKGTPTYTSSDNSVVTVNGNKLTGRKAGTAKITATFPGNGLYKSQTITFDVNVTFGLSVCDWTVEFGKDRQTFSGSWEYKLANTIVPDQRTLFFNLYQYLQIIGGPTTHSLNGAIYGNILPIQVKEVQNRDTKIIFNNFVSMKSYWLSKTSTTISLTGYSELAPYSDNVAGIQVEAGQTVTIEGNGILTLTGGNNGAAGIGGVSGTNAGNITINSGRLYATGKNGGSGIGGGKNASAGTITINDGTVFASHTGDGYDIGAGKGATATPIIIKGGSVKATSFNGNPTNGSAQVYRVTIGDLAPNKAISVTGLANYGTNSIYSDEEGKIYLWLPNDTYQINADDKHYTVVVKDKDGVLMPYHAGTAADPYLISNTAEWDVFSSIVNAGNTTAFGRLTNNVGPVQTMVGTESTPYAGTFDGNGYTLTLNISKPHNFAAPFSYVSGATIKNLFTAGTIEYTGQFAGGIIGLVGTNPATLTTCGSSARINFVNSGGGDTSTGGLVGGGVVTMSNCVFTGTLAGTTGKCRGGLMGWANAGTTITNCLQLGNFEVSADGSCTLVRGSNGVSIKNCYYKNILGDTQGTPVTDAQLASGEVAYKLQGNADATAWGQNIGTESYPVPTTDADYRVRKATFTINNKSVGTTYAAKSGEFSAPDVDVDYATTNPEEFYTMTDKDVNVEIQVWDKDTDGYFAINDRNDWDNLDALKYYDGVANFRLKADIDSITTMVGTDAVPFKGIFDGDGHTLTIDLTGTTQFTAPFSRVENATIKNLKVAGKLYQSGKGTSIYHASGLVGRANGVTLDRCVSSVALSFNDQGDAHSGGLVGHATTSTIKVSDCAFIGSFSEQAGRNNASVGGIVGWGETSCKVDIKNSYVDISSLTNIPGQNNLVRANNGWKDTGSTFSNCYYTVPAGAINYDPEPATLVTKEQMKSGEVAYKLQAAHTTDGNVWGQKIGTDDDPVLNSSDKVYTVAFTINNKAVNRYANNGGKVTLPTYAEFRSVLGNDFDNGKYTDNTLTFPGFDANTIVTADRTVVCQTNAKDFFDIASVSDWNKLATAVSEGQTRINARLTANISGVNTTIGSAANPYRGTFDGQRHTLNVNLSASTEELAPFSRTDGATIKNLTVSGSITSDKKYAGSIVGRAYNTTLNDVLGTATIKFTGTDDATFGGLIGVCSPNNGTTTLNNTAFTGTLDVANGNSIGGLVGWTEGNLNISNSLVAATINVQAASKANAGENNCALARRNDKVKATNCYVRSFNNMQTTQGTEITDEQLRNGSVAHDLQIKQKEMHWGQTLGTENQPRLSTDVKDQVFRVEFDYAATAKTDILATQFLNRGNTAKPLAFNAIKGHISNYDARSYYKINYEKFSFDTKIEQDYTVPTNYTSVKTFEINDANDWQTFANAVAEGQNYINAELKSDISGVTAMVGTQQAPYGGKFYGGYHTLTVDLTSNQQFCAPFQQVKNAEINNLRTAGTVTASAYHASGLVGRADWVHIHNCEVGVNIRFKRGYQGDDVHSGGFVGHGADNEIVIDKCAFNGSFSAADGQSFYGVGGFIGWGGSNATIKNSYVHNTPKGTGCQSYYPFIYRSDGLHQSTLVDCFAADYGDGGINFDQYNEPCTKLTRQQVENGYATYAMQKRIPEIDTQVEPVWGQKMDGTDKMPHVVGDNSDMKVVRNMFSANDSIYDNYFVIDENKDNIYNIKENYNSRFINYNLKLKRKFAPGWNTLVLPIETSYKELVEKLGTGTKVARFTNESENTIRLDTIATNDSYQELYNNEPFLVYTQTQDSVFTFSGKMISTTEYPAKYGNCGIDFVGSYAESYTVQPDEYFISGKCLWKSDGNTIIKGTRAFFRAANQSAGSNIYLVWGDDDDPTAINDATTDNASSTISGPVYNLNGHKVGDNINDMPKGIYIVNGKKIKK